MMTDIDKINLIEELLKTQDGRIRLSQAMAIPIRGKRVDYLYRYYCKECGMGWNSSTYTHSGEECVAYLVMES